MKAVTTEHADADAREAYDYYESKRRGLGQEFADELEAAVWRIEDFPEAWHPLDDTYRRCLLHRFPYGVIYRAISPRGEIRIIAIAHRRRHPGFWRDRE